MAKNPLESLKQWKLLGAVEGVTLEAHPSGEICLTQKLPGAARPEVIIMTHGAFLALHEDVFKHYHTVVIRRRLDDFEAGKAKTYSMKQVNQRIAKLRKGVRRGA